MPLLEFCTPLSVAVALATSRRAIVTRPHVASRITALLAGMLRSRTIVFIRKHRIQRRGAGGADLVIGVVDISNLILL